MAKVTLRGSISVGGSAFRYSLSNIHEIGFVTGFKIDPEPEGWIRITDIKIGRNSQLVNLGSFKASLLNRLDGVCLDIAPEGTEISLAIDITTHEKTFAGTCEITIDKDLKARSRQELVPAGLSQSSGTLDRVVVTPALEQAIKARDVVLYVGRFPRAPEHQEVSIEKIRVENIDGRLVPSKPVAIDSLHRVTYICEGPLAGFFSHADVVGLLTSPHPHGVQSQ